MKTRLFLLTALWLFPAVCNTSMGGDHSGKSLVLNDAVPALVDPTIDIRLRYEYGDQEALDPSHAATMRNRIGLLTRDLGGFQAFAEYEGTLAVDRDAYNPGNGNGPATRTVIADPESHELNQAWVSYNDPSKIWSLKTGRQGVNLDDQRYIGTVGWRQNMQTLDAAAVTWDPNEDLRVYYGYVWQVNRIFGSEAVAPPSTDFQGQSHLFNTQYKGLPFGTLTGYAYLLDLHNDDGDASSSNSYGLSLAGDFVGESRYLFEYAHQTDGADSPLDYSANYARADLSSELLPGVNGSVGYEYLGSDNGVGYKFPLATLHKFNGYADRFVNTPAEGLSDLYATVGTTVGGGIKLALTYHHFWDDGLDLSFGNEVDLVASKAITEHITILAKGAAFQGENGQPDLTRAVLEVDIVY